MLLIRCCNLMTSFVFFLMKNIYEYIHYIQSLKSIWTKIMSTWGCYFLLCLFFSSILFSFFVLLMPCEVCIFFLFLRKYWMYSKKMTRNPCWYQIYFFSPQKISKYRKSFKEFNEAFFTQWRRKSKCGMDTVGHTASTILVVKIMTEN